MNPTTPKRRGRARRGDVPEPDGEELASQRFQFEPGDGPVVVEPATDEEPPLPSGSDGTSAASGRAETSAVGPGTDVLAARIFANLNLEDEELKLYERYYESLAKDIPPPDLVIYLQAKPEVLRARIAKKAMKDENQISTEYIEEVSRAYEHFFFRYEASDLLVIDTSEIDFVARNEDLQQLLRRLQEPVKGTQYFLPLGAAE